MGKWLNLPKIVDSPEARRREKNAAQLKKQGRHAEARREQHRSNVAWRRDTAGQKGRWW